MSGALVPLFGNRPAVIQRNGWVEYISLHDAAYLAEKKRLRSAMIAAHPDKLNQGKSPRYQVRSGWRFLKAKDRIEKFMVRERIWYWERDLMPPDWEGEAEPPPGDEDRPKSSKALVAHNNYSRTSNKCNRGGNYHRK